MEPEKTDRRTRLLHKSAKTRTVTEKKEDTSVVRG